jgi:hypothetical protein
MFVVIQSTAIGKGHTLYESLLERPCALTTILRYCSINCPSSI